MKRRIQNFSDEVFGGVFSGSFMKAFNFTSLSNGSADGPVAIGTFPKLGALVTLVGL